MDFPRPLARFAAALFLATVTVAAVVALGEPAPPVEALAVLGVLALYSAQRQVRLPNGVSVSPGFMVCMAAMVVFVGEGSLIGLVIVAVLSNLRVEQFTRRRVGWIPFNAGVAGLAFVAGAVLFRSLPTVLAHDLPGALIGVVLATVVYLAVAWSLLVVSYVIEEQRPWRETLIELAPMGVQVMPFAFLGFFIGRLYLDLGPGVMVLIVVPILIAREMFASYMKVKEAHDETVQMLIRALEQKDRYTAGHAERVATYAQYMGEQLNFGPARMERLRFAALMHDIGKLVVPNHLLNKPGKLTPDEFTRIRIHEKVSVQMLSHIDFLRPIAATTHSDAMRFDADDAEHPIEPYIVMIADAYDAMTSTRAYRKALPQDVAFQELRDKAGVQFHPQCVEALIAAIEAREERHGAGYEVQSEFADAPDAGLGSAGLGDLLPSEA